MRLSNWRRREFLRAGLAGVTAVAGTIVGASDLRGQTETPTNPLVGRTPHTKFAVNVEMWWRSVDFYERIRKAAELGFPAIEFWPYQNKDIDKVAQLCRDLKLAVAQFTAWGFTPGMNHPDNEELFLARIQEACQVAHRLHCDKMCVVAGNNQPGMTKEQMHAQVIRALRRAAVIVEREKVMLILEPMNGRVDHPGHCLYGSEDAVRICRAVNSPYVKINWDLYHMQISEGDLCGHLREGFDQLGYVQIADHPGRHEPGTGEIHYNRVLRELHELGYRGYVGLELVPKSTERAAAEAVAAADVW